ncbi:hypothetical protein GGI42DRAFT_309690, partial [Trichoderma sp. SZMC 28013]
CLVTNFILLFCSAKCLESPQHLQRVVGLFPLLVWTGPELIFGTCTPEAERSWGEFAGKSYCMGGEIHPCPLAVKLRSIPSATLTHPSQT